MALFLLNDPATGATCKFHWQNRIESGIVSGREESVCGLWKLLVKTSTFKVFRQVHNSSGAVCYFRSFHKQTSASKSGWVAGVPVLQQQKV